jgi:hypothetical protein
MVDKQIKELLKNNWVGKLVNYKGGKYEVIDENEDELQVIAYGKWSAQWIRKSEVSK